MRTGIPTKELQQFITMKVIFFSIPILLQVAVVPQITHSVMFIAKINRPGVCPFF